MEPGEIDYVYDALGRLLEANYADGSYFHYTYDEVGNRLTETTLSGATLYSYDAANRLIATSTDNWATQTNYDWDNNGNLLSDGVTTYTYDAANRLSTVSSPGTSIEYRYNGLGDRLQETENGGTRSHDWHKSPVS